MSEEIEATEGGSTQIADDTAVVLPPVSKLQTENLTNAGLGRPKGKPNRITRDMRRAAQFIVDKRRDRFITWLDRVGRKDPAYACELYIKLLATFTPRPTAGSFEAQMTAYPAGAGGPTQPSVLAMRVRQVLEAPVP